MNLGRHAGVLWRFRLVTAVGVASACSSHSSPPSEGIRRLSPRGSETWTAISSILVTQPGFPEGRVTLPTKPRRTPPRSRATPRPPRTPRRTTRSSSPTRGASQRSATSTRSSPRRTRSSARLPETRAGPGPGEPVRGEPERPVAPHGAAHDDRARQEGGARPQRPRLRGAQGLHEQPAGGERHRRRQADRAQGDRGASDVVRRACRRRRSWCSSCACRHPRGRPSARGPAQPPPGRGTVAIDTWEAPAPSRARQGVRRRTPDPFMPSNLLRDGAGDRRSSR